jgi:hypothetical protein
MVGLLGYVRDEMTQGPRLKVLNTFVNASVYSRTGIPSSGLWPRLIILFEVHLLCETKVILTLYGHVQHPTTFRSVPVLQHIANVVPFWDQSSGITRGARWKLTLQV